MRHSYILSFTGLLLGLLLFGACSEDFERLSPDPRETFFKLYGGAYNQEAVQLLALDRGYLLLGSTSTPSQDESEEIYLVETDLAGNHMQSTTINTGNPDAEGKPRAMIKSTNGGFLICGTATDTSGLSDAWLLKLSDSYEVEWKQTFGRDEEEEDAIAMVEADDGSIFVLGSSTWVDPLKGEARAGVVDSTDLYLMKIAADATGPLWTKSYGYTGTDRAADLLKLPNGNMALLGVTDYPDNGRLDKDVFVVLVNELGNAFHTQTFGAPEVDEIPTRMNITPEGLAITGLHRPASGSASVLFLLLSFQLDPITAPMALASTSVSVGQDLQPLEDGSGDLMLIGTVDAQNNKNEDMLLLRLSTSGNIIQGPQFFGNERRDQGASLLIQDENILLLGTSEYLSNTMMTLYKLPLDGEL